MEDPMRFEWDEEKNRSNYRKHGIWFAEAKTAFFDDEAIVFDDPDHSVEENRFLLLGLSSMARALVVVHCLRGPDDVIRIISARRATKTERETYARGVS
ncbi:MAG: BrnT family toxin [bacterium]|nr:BrnT family toxin [bacterium]